MNPDQPSREQIETRLTALLLGELPTEEAALLRYTIAQDPALQKLHDELQATLVLVREAAQHPEAPAAEKAAPLQLSADRRQKLLAHFKTPRPAATPNPLFWLKPIKLAPLVKVLTLVAILAVLAALLLPALSRSKSRSMRGQYGAENTWSALKSRIWSSENQPSMAAAPADLSLPHGSKLATEPEQLTLAPEPVLAPPPATLASTPIVLPATESAPEVAAANANKSAEGGVYSQNIVGYVNVPHILADKKEPPVAAAQGGLGQPPAAKSASAGEQVTFAPQPVLLPPPAAVPSTPIALPQTEPAQAVAASSAASLPNDQRPPAQQPHLENENLGLTKTITVQTSPAGGAATGLVTYGEKLDEAAKKLNEASKLEPEVRSAAKYKALLAQAEAQRNQVIHNTDTQDRLEHVEKNWVVPGQSKAVDGLVLKDTANRSQAGLATDSVDQNRAFGGIAGGAGGGGGGGGQPAKIPAPPIGGPISTASAALPTLQPTAPAGATAPGNAPVSTAGEVSLAMPEPAPAPVGVANYSFNPGAALEQPKTAVPVFGDAPIAGVYFRLTTNTVAATPATPALPPLAVDVPAPEQPKTALNYQFAAGANSQPPVADTFNPGVSAISPGKPVSEWSSNATSRAYFDGYYNNATAKNPASDQAKRQLEQKLELRHVLDAKLQNEKVNLALPQTAMVQITDPARTNQDRTFWQHLTGQYESQARLKVENDTTDIVGMSDGRQYAAYDPYFIQTTFEAIKSKLVLSNVVTRLNLQSAWADKNGGQKLTLEEAVSRLKSQLDLQPVRNTKTISIGVTSDDPAEAANLANAVSEAYRDYRFASRQALTRNGLTALEQSYAHLDRDIQTNAEYLQRLEGESHSQVSPTEPPPAPDQSDRPLRKPAPNTPVPQPEILTSTNAFSTFSLNVSDVSFKFAAASLQNNQLPDTASIRSEEFINAFDYRDPEAAAGQPMAFAAERARYPFAHNRELLRFAIKTAAAGRQEGRALNLVLLLDVSGSMERADRVAIIHEALRVLGTQLQPQDTVSVVTFARTARLWADGIPGNQAAATLDRVGGITPEGGTNLEEAMRLAYETARRHYLASGMNRVVLLTDGAANLGDVSTADLQAKVETQRKQGIALDCFGIGWEDYNDDLLETLSSHGDGRYAFLNSPEEAARDFAAKLAGALQIAAADVKVQVEFNPNRVIAYRQIGYAKHQLTKEQFRDNTVAAGEIAAQEAGNALYTIETNPAGDGPVATVHVRYRIPGTSDFREQSWDVPYTGSAPALEQTSAAMRLAAVAAAFSEWLAASPYGQEVTPNALLNLLSGVPEVYGADNRPKQLETMILEARSLVGK